MNKGICILVESPDGAGKDTLIENIKSHYADLNFKIYKFPSGEYRKKILATPRTQAELVPLFCADFNHTIQQIKNDLRNGKNIIINRMYVSTIIYALESQVPESIVYYHIEDAIGKWRPDITAILDIDPEEAFKRLSSRTDEKNWLDGDFDKQIRINRLYKDFLNSTWQKLYSTNSSIFRVDSNGSRSQTFNNFKSQFDKWLKSKNKTK